MGIMFVECITNVKPIDTYIDQSILIHIHVEKISSTIPKIYIFKNRDLQLSSLTLSVIITKKEGKLEEIINPCLEMVKLVFQYCMHKVGE